MKTNIYFFDNLKWILLMLFGSLLSMNGFISSGVVAFISFILLMPTVYRNWNHLPMRYRTFSIWVIILLFAYAAINSSSILYPIKFLCYVLSFLFGYIAYTLGVIPHCKKMVIFLISAIPVAAYLLLGRGGKSGGIFDIPNTYVYYGLSVAIMYYLCNYNKKNAMKTTWLILGIYILSATKLGIVVAFVISVVLYSLRSVHQLFLSALLCLIGIIAIKYIDFPIFIRIRDVYEFASSIPLDAYKTIGDSSAYEIGEMYGKNGGDSDTSFVFRLVHWTRLLTYWIESTPIHLLFGYGDMYAKENFRLQPHNEYVKLLLENGVLIFMLFVSFIVNAFKKLRVLKCRYLLIMPLVFMFTENLLYFSVMNLFVFMSMGYFISYSENNTPDEYHTFVNSNSKWNFI